jgi:hypothetical protein
VSFLSGKEEGAGFDGKKGAPGRRPRDLRWHGAFAKVGRYD